MKQLRSLFYGQNIFKVKKDIILLIIPNISDIILDLL